MKYPPWVVERWQEQDLASVLPIPTIPTLKVPHAIIAVLKLRGRNDKNGNNYTTMTIDRNQIVAEQMIRAHVRKRIKAQVLQEYAQEKQLRKAIRRMILEAETGTEVKVLKPPAPPPPP